MFVQLLNSFHAVPCQNVLHYFKSVLEFNSQLIQTLPEEQLTEVRPQTVTSQPPSAFSALALTGLLSPQDEERHTVFEVCLILALNLDKTSHLNLHEGLFNGGAAAEA